MAAEFIESPDDDDGDGPGAWTVTADMERGGLAALRRARFERLPEEVVPQYVYRVMRDNEPLRWGALRWAGIAALAYAAFDLASAYPRTATIALLALGTFHAARLGLRNLRARRAAAPAVEGSQ